jgi:glycosyltransferase involved in cell wall biosynthesis
MVKVSILSGFFPPKWTGGIELATYYLAKQLQATGNEVHVLTSRDPGMPKEERQEGVIVHRLYWPKLPILRNAFFQLSLFLAVKKIDPDIIHFQSFSLSTLGILTKAILKKPYIVVGHGADIYFAHKLSRLNFFFLRLILKTTIKNANAVVALTDHMKQRIQQDYGRDSIVIPDGIDLKKFSVAVSKESARTKLELKHDEEIIVFVGNLRLVKGVEYLIRALEIIRDREPLIRLLVIGGAVAAGGETEAAEQDRLNSLVRKLGLVESVTFIGSIPNDRIPEYLAASDIFVLPSLSEGFGIVLLEAMAAALPIVATNVTGVPSIVKEGVNAFLVEPRNATQIADKVITLLNDPELRHRMSENNRVTVQKYAWERVVNDLEQVYLSCLKSQAQLALMLF